MITKLTIQNFKGFKNYEITFDRVNLLVGGNNCGKTTIFHALQTIFWCINQTRDIGDNTVTFRKTQVPEIGAIPYFNPRDIFFQQHLRTGRVPTRICFKIETTVAPPLEFKIYTAFGRNFIVDGGNATITKEQYEAIINLSPVYIPGTIGITVKEELYRVVAQERLILEGRQNQVIRNLVYRLKQSTEWSEFISMLNPLFQLNGIAVPFDEESDEWLTATYREKNCEFDLVSAGSGFLQVINLLSFLFLHTSKVALLDEPDSHMHDDLQRLTFDGLDKLSKKRNVQLIIATHSPILIDAAGLSNILIIDREFEKPLKAQKVDTLIPLLGDRGLALPPAKVSNTLKSRKALFVEGAEADYIEFLERLGEVYRPGFRAITRGLTIFETQGITNHWPYEAIGYFETLIGVPLNHIYLSDRDFFTDVQIAEREQKAIGVSKKIHHLQRRNRESYLLEPLVLSRLLINKWLVKHPNEENPQILTEAGIKQFILTEARVSEDETRTTLLVQQEPNLKGDSTHRTEKTRELNDYFRSAYTEPLSRDEIPYKLMDSQLVLRKFRTKVTDDCHISFSDREILESFQTNEISEEIRTFLDSIIAMFPNQLEVNVAVELPNNTTPQSSSNTTLNGRLFA